MHVTRLREKLRDNPAEPAIVLTVRGKGYMIGAKLDKNTGGSAPCRSPRQPVRERQGASRRWAVTQFALFAQRMFRPSIIWLAFGVCLAVVVAAVGWLSFRALEADDAEAAARHQAALEENAQLALWRMDSAMAPLVAQESARPYFTYESFYSIARPAAADERQDAGGGARAVAAIGRMPAGSLAAFSNRAERSILVAARSRSGVEDPRDSALSEPGRCGTCGEGAGPRAVADQTGRG